MLVRYCGPYLIDDLAKKRMSVSKPSNFNDPFEYHLTPGPEMSRKDARRQMLEMEKRPSFVARMARNHPELKRKELLNYIKERRRKNADILINNQEKFVESWRERPWTIMDRTTRVMCLSSLEGHKPHEIPMWAYYADMHKGARIRLDENAFADKATQTLAKMIYSDHPPVIDFSQFPTAKAGLEFTRLLLRSKAKAWEHENEFRIEFDIATCECDKSSGVERWYARLKSMKLKFSVDLGIRCSKDTREKAIALRSIYPNMALFQATKSPTSYKIIYQEFP